jgi:hypothetical protein
VVDVVILGLHSVLAAQCRPNPAAYRFGHRDRTVPASLAGHGQAGDVADGHLVDQEVELDGGSVDEFAGAGGAQDVLVHIAVQAGPEPHRRIISRIALRQDAVWGEG